MYKPTPDVRSYGAESLPNYGGQSGEAVSPLDAAYAAAMKTMEATDTPLYGFEQYTPYEYAKRYMSGRGHSGYIGMQSSEDYNAQRQNNWIKASNGLMKGTGVALTSFIDGTVGTLVGLTNWIDKKKFSAFFDNPVTNAMEDFRKLTEEWAPNYYTDVERNAEWYSTDNWFKTNFLFDKLIKNAGFAAAAIGEGALVAKLLQGLTKMTAVGKMAQAVDELEYGLSAVSRGEKASDAFKGFGSGMLKSYLQKPIAGMTEIESLSARAAKVEKATASVINKAASVVATTAEANAEALQGTRRLREELIQSYKDANNGNFPDAETMKDIEMRAAEGGSIRFGMNVLTLGISNMIQFPRLLNGSLSAEKGAIAREIKDVAVDKTGAATARAGENYVTKSALMSTKQKAFSSLAKKLGAVELSEGAEEGMQYAIEEGIHEYEMMAQHPKAVEAIKNIFTHGLSQTINSKEGMESVMLGILTGGLMNKATNFGKNTKIQKNTTAFLSEVNKAPQAADVIAYKNENDSYSAEMVRSISRGFAAQQEKEQGHAQGDMVKVKDADAKAFIAYALPRIKYGRFDLLQSELDQYASMPFDEVKKELGLPENVTQEDVNKRINSLKEKAAVLKNLYESMSMRFGQQVVKKDGKVQAKYTPKQIDELVYHAFRVADYERRYNDLFGQVNDALGKSNYKGKFSLEALFDKSLRKDENNKEVDLERIRTQMYKQLNSIQPDQQQDKDGVSYAEKLRDLERIQNRREEYLYHFEDVKSQDIMDLDAFELENASLDDYLKFERQSKNRTLMRQLDKNTERRPDTKKLMDFVNAKLKEGWQSSEIVSAIKAENTFVYDGTKENVMAQNVGESSVLEEAIQQYSDQMDTLDPTDPEDMAMMGEAQVASDNLQAALDKLMTERQDIPKFEDEPFIGNDYAIRRALADSYVGKADVFLSAAKQDADYGDEKTVSAISKVINELKKLKSIFADRKDGIGESQEFRGFEDKLKTAISDLEELNQKIKERIADREAIQNQAVEDYAEVRSMAVGYDVRNQKVISQKLYDLFKSLIGEKELSELLKQLSSTKQLYYADILVDFVNQKATNEQKDQFKAAIEEEMKSLAKQIDESTFAKEFKKGAVGTKKENIKKLLENPGAYIHQVIEEVAYGFRDKTDNPFGRYLVKHGNTRQLQKDLEATGGEYNYVKGSTPEFLELYHQYRSLADLSQVIDSTQSQYDIYARLEKQVKEDMAANRPVPTQQQMLAIRETLTSLFSGKPVAKAYDGWIYLEGVIGAGKTSVFGRYVLNAYKGILGKNGVTTDINTLVQGTADLQTTAENLTGALGLTTAKSIPTVITELKNGTFAQNLIIVDEFARAGRSLSDELASAVEEFNKTRDKQVRVLAIGDQAQIRNVAFISSLPTNITHVYPLTISYRSNVNAIADIQQRFKSKGVDVTQGIVTESNFADPKEAGDEKLYGVAGSTSLDQMLDTIASRPASVSKAIIVDDGTQSEVSKKVFERGLQVPIISAREAQGKTWDDVYLWMAPEAGAAPLEYNTRMYTSARGRNFVYLGGINVKTNENKQILSGITKNDSDNTNRAKATADYLNQALDEFEKYFGVDTRTTVPATGIIDQQQSEIKQEAQVKKEEVEDELEDVGDQPAITPDSNKVEVPVEANTIVIDNPVPERSPVVQMRSPFFGGLKRSAGISEDTNSQEFRVVPVVRQDSNGEEFVQMYLMREHNGLFYEIAVIGNQGPNPEIDKFPQIKKAWEEISADYKSKKGSRVLRFSQTGKRGEFVLDSRREFLDEYTVAKGKIVTAKSVSYNYSNTAGGPLRFADTVRKWFADFFSSPDATVKPAVDAETAVKGARIVTLSSKEADEINNKLSNRLVKPGFTYIEITDTNQEGWQRKGIPQYIELKGRVLNNNGDRNSLVHVHKIINPMRRFMGKVKAFDAMLQPFLSNPEVRLMTGGKLELGSPLYNLMVRELSDNNWETNKKKTTDRKINASIEELEQKRKEELLAGGSPIEINRRYDAEILTLLEDTDESYSAEDKAFLDRLFDFLKTGAVEKAKVVEAAREIDELVYGRERHNNFQKQFFYEKEGKKEILSQKDIDEKNEKYQQWIAAYGDARKAFRTGWDKKTKKDMDGNIVPIYGPRSSSTGVIQRIMNKLAQANRLVKTPSGDLYFRTMRVIKGKTVLSSRSLLEISSKEKNAFNYSEARLMESLLAELGILEKYPNGLLMSVQGRNYPFNAPIENGKRVTDNAEPIRPEDLAALEERKSQVKMGPLTMSDLETMFGDNAFDAQGSSLTSLRANIPIEQNWKQSEELTDEYGNAVMDDKNQPITLSAEELHQNYLETNFVSVSPTQLSVTIDGATDSNGGVKPQAESPQPEKKKTSPFKKLYKGPNDAAPKLKSKFKGSTDTIEESKLKDYVKKFIPNLSDEELQVLDPLAMMRLESIHGLQDTWGMFVDKVIYLVNNKRGVYRQVVRHEVFHKIFRNFLNSAERAEIINDAREQFGWTGPNFKTDYQIEEELADIFGNRSERPEGIFSNIATSINRFFRKVATIFGLVSKGRHRIETMFELIESGAFQQPSKEPTFGAAAKRKFKTHYNNDFDLANRVESLWHAYLSSFNTPQFTDEDGQRNNEPPMVLREIKESFIDALRSEQQDLQDKGLELTAEEARYLQAIDVALLQRNNKYVVLNDLIKELYPKSASWEYLNDEEFVNDEDMVATLDDIINKDDNVDFHSKLTDNVKRFLGSLFVEVQGQVVPIRVTNALAKLYKTVTNFDTSSDSFKDNIIKAFEVEHDLKYENNKWEGNQYTAAIADALISLIKQSNIEESQFVVNKKGVVFLNPDVYFKNENTFVYFGQEIKRTGAEEMIMLEKKLAVAETDVDKEQIETEIEGKTFKVESTKDFYARIINEVAAIDKEVGDSSFISEATTEDAMFLLKEVWARDMAQDTLQDMMNLINSGYDVQPRIVVRKGYKDQKIFDYVKLGSNRAVVAYKDNIDSAIRQAVASDKWDIIDSIRASVKSAFESKSPKDQNAAINAFFIQLGVISPSRPLAISSNKQKTALEAIDRILTGLSQKDSAEQNNNHLTGMSSSMRVVAKLIENSDNNQTQASYTDGEGKKRFFQRYIDFAQRTAINLMRKADNLYKVATDSYMNPTQPFKEFTKLYALNYFNPDSGYKINRIFDYGLHDSIKEDWRDFTVQFSNETEVEFMERNFYAQFMGKINEMSSSSLNYLTYGQQPYTISNKTYIKTYEVGVLGTSSKGQVGTIRQAIKAALLQEFYRPDPKDEKFTITRNGQKINPLDIKNYNSRKASISQLTGIEGPAAELWQKMRSAIQSGKAVTEDQYTTLVNAVEKAMSQKADEYLAQMFKTDKISRLDEGFVKDTYKELLGRGVITSKDIPSEIATVKTGENVSVEFKDYNAAEPKFLRPLVQLWYKNFYLNGLMLNQITVGDQAMFKNEYDEIKRMSIFHGIGQSMMVGPRYARQKFRVIVGEDIKSLFDTTKASTDYNFQQSLTDAEVNKMLKEINWTDGQGLMSMRRFEDLQKGYGPGANLQNTLKPVYAGIDQYGVNRTLKYSSVVITDELARKFPLLRELRIKMELNGLTGTDWSRAKTLLEKKIDSGNLSVKEVRELTDLFSKNVNLYLDEFVADSATKTGIPNGKLSFDRSTGRYQGFSMDDMMLPEAAIIDMDNRNWRIQINPAHDIDSHVSLFTQLMYFANFDGRNPEEANSMYSALGSLFGLGITEMKEALEITNVPDLTAKKPKQLEKPIREMLKKKMGSMPGKEKAHEFLEHNVSLNAPFLVNDMVTQLASMFNKSIIRPKFNGSKFVLQSAMLTHDVYQNGKINEVMVPKFDAEKNVMEVYLPNIFKKFLPEEYRSMSDQQLMEMFDKGEVVLNNMMLGFRIPSTGINSAVRIKVKGIYPSENNIIIAPPNITFQHGSDYDVDSLFIIRPTTYTKSEVAEMEKAGFTVSEGESIGQAQGFSNSFQKKLEDEPALRSVLKGYLKNKIVNTYMNLLAKQENREDILKPITFDIPKNAERWDSLFNMAAYYSADPSVGSQMAEFRPLVDKVKEGTVTPEDMKRLEALREEILFTRRDINDPLDLMKMQLDNKSGTKLTGIAANSAKGVAYLLNATTDGELPKLNDDLRFTIDGVEYDGIARVDRGVGGGTQVSEHFSWMVNAAIDNVKEQILQVINMSIGMGNLWLGFTALGMRPAHTLLMLKQPYVQPLVNLNRIKKENVDTIREEIEGKIAALGGSVNEVAISIKDLENLAPLTIGAIDKLSKAEQLAALSTQLAVMDVISKGTRIGNSLFSTTRALSILQNIPPTYEEQQDVLDAIFDIYESETEAVTTGDQGPFATTASYKKHSFLENRPLNKRYAFENVDLFKLPHWAKAYEQFKLLTDLEKAAFFKHSRKMQDLTLLVKNHFGLVGRRSIFTFKDNEDNRMIRDELIKYFFTGLKFNQFGRTVDFNSTNEVYTVTNRERQYTVYGPEAFIQRFIDKVQSLKLHPSYSDNEFLKKLRISKDRKGIQRLSMADISAITHIDNKVLENEFVKLGAADREIYLAELEKEIAENLTELETLKKEALAEAKTEQQRAEIEEKYSKKIYFENKRLNNKWYSELQTDFVKYLVLAEGLRFSGSTFATILPAEIYLPVFKAFDKAMDNIASRDMKELSRVIEHFGLSLILNKADDMQNSVRGLDMDYSTSSVKTEKIGGKDIYYNLKIKGTPGTALTEQQKPRVIKKSIKPYSDNPMYDPDPVDYVFVRMDVSSDNHEAYYALAGKANTHQTYNFRWDLFNETYRFNDHFKGDMVNLISNDVVIETTKIKKQELQTPVLYYGKELPVGSLLSVAKPSDATRIYAQQYKVSKLLKEASAPEVKKELLKKIDELKVKERSMKITDREVRVFEAELETLKKKIDSKQKPTEIQLKNVEEKTKQLAAMKLRLQEKGAVSNELQGLFTQLNQAKFKYELMEIKSEFETTPVQVSADDLRVLYNKTDNFSADWSDEEVLAYHDQVMKGNVLC